jgi:hypothetical protein
MSTENETRILSPNLIDVPLESLRVQYVHGVTPIELWNYDMALATSPHVELLKKIAKYGLNWNVIMKTRYWAERAHRRNIGMAQWTGKHIREHILVRWKTYLSLRDNGFTPEMYTGKTKSHPIKVMSTPMWESRFGYKAHFLRGPEIFDGAGRCSAACALGWKKIPVVWVEDARAGTKNPGGYKEKLESVKGVWDWMKDDRKAESLFHIQV